ncbi:MAG: UDP-N-acetylglucosamine 2-epimerase (non-hydrolyzing) [Acuticoccus sp.]
MTILGTRPELIRLSRVIAEFDRAFHHVLVHTGQNSGPGLIDVFLADFGLRAPDHTLAINGGGFGATVGRLLEATDALLARETPDALVVLGDTNSALAVLPAKRRKIPIFHIEAGNRCRDPNVPEEINRRIVDHTSDVNIAYSDAARRNLLAEGLDPQLCLRLGSPLDEVLAACRPRIDACEILARLDLAPGGYFVASLHRAETVDDPARLAAAFDALVALGAMEARPVVVSVHPRTRDALARAGHCPDALARAGLRLCDPFGFFDYVHLQRHAACVLSDSGSLSEEAALLGFPAVALRETHERLEAMDAATTILAPPRPETVPPAVRLAMRHAREGPGRASVDDYRAPDFAQALARLVMSHIPYVNTYVWRKPP